MANWLIHELPPVQGNRSIGELPFGPAAVAELVRLVRNDTISSTGGREVLEVLGREGGTPREIVDRLDLAQVSDPDALEPVVRRVVEAHPDEATSYGGGKRALVGFFIGQVMRETGGKADPGLARRLLEEELGG